MSTSGYPHFTAAIAAIAAVAALSACALEKQTPSEPARQDAQPAQHARAGQQAASPNFEGYANLCDLEMRFRNVNVLKTDPVVERAPRSADQARERRSGRDRSAPPMRVFDNLYFVGNQAVSSWLLGTEDGYILIDAMNSDEEARTIIDAGIRKLGLNPENIKYLLITHAHGDHFGGYKYIKETYDPTIVMSERDWTLAAQLREHPRFGLPPQKDMGVTEGDKLTAGTTTLDIHVTRAHTPGTISPIFTVYDNGTPYRAVMWGGTGFNFGADAQRLDAYAASARRIKTLAQEQDVQVFLSNHGRRDGSLDKMKLLQTRSSSEPHPFVMGPELFSVFDVLEQCALAQSKRLKRDAGSP